MITLNNFFEKRFQNFAKIEILFFCSIQILVKIDHETIFKFLILPNLYEIWSYIVTKASINFENNE